MYRVAGILMSAMLPMLIGCRTPPDYNPMPPQVGVLSSPSAGESIIEATALVPAVKPAPDRFTVPDFIALVVRQNLRLIQMQENVEVAKADYITDSLIPNCQLFTDSQLIPLQTVDINNQAGPIQYDVLVTVPIDWLMFGKRVAARQAGRLNVEVQSSQQDDLIRRVVTDAVLAVYDLLEAEKLLKLSEEDIELLEGLEKLIRDRKDADANTKIDAERMKLAVLDSYREQHRKEAARDTAKAKLRPLIGRKTTDADFSITGSLEVVKAAPAVSLEAALELARRHRPDLRRDEQAIGQAMAAIKRERRKGLPQVSITTGYSYQDQFAITGFRNASLGNIAVTTSLPCTDRNQGNIRKAQAGLRANLVALEADTADALAEVESAVAAYREAREAVTSDDPKSLESAKRVREQTVKAYSAGDKGILDLLDAVKAHRERERNIISTKTDYWQALHKLNGMVGLRALETDTE